MLSLDLCKPAKLYLVISTISVVLIGLQNINSNNTYCVGDYICPVDNIWLLFLMKIVYIAFWTWLLNVMCKSGATIVSWIFVLVPIISMFLIIMSFFALQNIPVI